MFYVLNWIYRYATTPYYWDWISWLAGALQTALFVDFFYYFAKRCVAPACQGGDFRLILVALCAASGRVWTQCRCRHKTAQQHVAVAVALFGSYQHAKLATRSYATTTTPFRLDGCSHVPTVSWWRSHRHGGLAIRTTPTTGITAAATVTASSTWVTATCGSHIVEDFITFQPRSVVLEHKATIVLHSVLPQLLIPEQQQHEASLTGLTDVVQQHRHKPEVQHSNKDVDEYDTSDCVQTTARGHQTSTITAAWVRSHSLGA